MTQIPLHPHPATPCPHINTFSAGAQRTSNDMLILEFRMAGDLDALQIPPLQPAAPADGLWRSTCFEAFIRRPGERGYLELNASPSSQWAVYRFDGYRQGMQALAPDEPPEIVCHPHETTLDATVRIPLAALGASGAGELELGLAAVVQDKTGTLRYWALAHPEGKPDFHHPASFVLSISRSRALG